MPTAKRPQKIDTETVFTQVARGRWSATVDTPTGPITAVGDSQGEAQRQLEELLTMRSALAYTRAQSKP